MVLVGLLFATGLVLMNLHWPKGSGLWANRVLVVLLSVYVVVAVGGWLRQFTKDPVETLQSLRHRPIILALELATIALVVAYASLPIWSGLGEEAWTQNRSGFFVVYGLLSLPIGMYPRNQRRMPPTGEARS
jgi:hypothetical protein